MKACVIIPTYNEAQDLGKVIREVRLHNSDILVVDDGSSDSTPKIAAENGAVVIISVSNEGKGASLIKGFKYAMDNGYDAVITMDGDGQHLPEDLPSFIRLAQYSGSGILIGNRMQKTEGMPLVRLLTNKFMSWLLSLMTKQNIPDTQCGFRLIKREVLEKIKLVTSKYDTESEILIETSRLGFKIESVPVKTVYISEKSHINPFIDTFRFIKLIVRELWTSRR